MKDKFGRELKQARIANGLSVKQLAERAKISSAAIYKYEAGEAEPALSKAIVLRDLLGPGRFSVFQEQAPVDVLSEGDLDEEVVSWLSERIREVQPRMTRDHVLCRTRVHEATLSGQLENLTAPIIGESGEAPQRGGVRALYEIERLPTPGHVFRWELGQSIPAIGGIHWTVAVRSHTGPSGELIINYELHDDGETDPRVLMNAGQWVFTEEAPQQWHVRWEVAFVFNVGDIAYGRAHCHNVIDIIATVFFEFYRHRVTQRQESEKAKRRAWRHLSELIPLLSPGE